jgi:serine/threonine-protein kinase HipA
MTSNPDRAFVWIWPPGEAEPVVAGRLDLDRDGGLVVFTYGGSYLAREDAIPLFLPELPLQRGTIVPTGGEVAGCIADAAPDAWGQRVVLNRHGEAENPEDLNLLTYLLESGSDRVGALDFQESAEDYVARGGRRATLAELGQLVESAAKVEAGVPLSPEVDAALLHGSSIGGARPKALVDDGERRLIAKFSSSTDTFAVVKAEFVAMELARRAGIEAAPVELTQVLGKDVLLVERFDRGPGGSRRAMVSALTILGLHEMIARYASYADLADAIRARFTAPRATLHELFGRIVFNILCSNNDDHARNHAAFWDGRELSLTAAYDICPQRRAGNVTEQLMAIGRDGFRESRVAGCVERAGVYQLEEAEARVIVDRQIAVIESDWDEVCDVAELPAAERSLLWRRQFLNPYATEGY